MARASTIRAAIVTAITGTIPDNRATASDVFRQVDVGQIDVLNAPDRVFVIKLASQPQRIEVNNCDTWQVEYDIQFFYNASQSGIDDRIALDSERFHAKVERLFETATGVMLVDIAPGGLVEVSDSTVVSVWSVLVKYQLDSAVVNN
jgi:hypothetical protein